jgi:hypothetical protein
MEGDELRAELNGIEEDEVEESENPLLTEVLDFYDCSDLIPTAHRILRLSAIKEALGCIPNDIPVDYEDLCHLLILQDEYNKKVGYENYKMKMESKRQQAELESKSSNY